MDKVFDLRAMVRGRIDALRAALHTHGLAAWILPSADPHLSEYLPERWQGREWASGFTGSAGTLVVTADTAGLWSIRATGRRPTCRPRRPASR